MPSPVQELSYSLKIPMKTEHFTAGKGMPFPYRTITNNSINRNLPIFHGVMQKKPRVDLRLPVVKIFFDKIDALHLKTAPVEGFETACVGGEAEAELVGIQSLIFAVETLV